MHQQLRINESTQVRPKIKNTSAKRDQSGSWIMYMVKRARAAKACVAWGTHKEIAQLL